MRRQLPSLTALRVFEAAARHLNFTRAAEELHVTPAAVSHQIKTLEHELGTPVFVRELPRLRLTDAGNRLLPVLKMAFDDIALIADQVRAPTRTATVSVSVMPGLSAKWLAPRLPRFLKKYPGIDLRLIHSIKPEAFSEKPEHLDRESIDVAIRCGPNDWSDKSAELLFRVNMVPTCSPELIDAKKPPQHLSDLRHHTLLHEVDHSLWAEWIKTYDMEDIDPSQGIIMDELNVLVNAAIHGIGVALVPQILIGEDIAAGRLVIPFPYFIRSDVFYFIVHSPGAIRRSEVQCFRNWLLAEATLGGWDGAPDAKATVA